MVWNFWVRGLTLQLLQIGICHWIRSSSDNPMLPIVKCILLLIFFYFRIFWAAQEVDICFYYCPWLTVDWFQKYFNLTQISPLWWLVRTKNYVKLLLLKCFDVTYEFWQYFHIVSIGYSRYLTNFNERILFIPFRLPFNHQFLGELSFKKAIK